MAISPVRRRITSRSTICWSMLLNSTTISSTTTSTKSRWIWSSSRTRSATSRGSRGSWGPQEETRCWSEWEGPDGPVSLGWPHSWESTRPSPSKSPRTTRTSSGRTIWSMSSSNAAHTTRSSSFCSRIPKSWRNPSWRTSTTSWILAKWPICGPRRTSRRSSTTWVPWPGSPGCSSRGKTTSRCLSSWWGRTCTSS